MANNVFISIKPQVYKACRDAGHVDYSQQCYITHPIVPSPPAQHTTPLLASPRLSRTSPVRQSTAVACCQGLRGNRLLRLGERRIFANGSWQL